jgi:hypothetical protein
MGRTTVAMSSQASKAGRAMNFCAGVLLASVALPKLVAPLCAGWSFPAGLLKRACREEWLPTAAPYLLSYSRSQNGGGSIPRARRYT